MMNRQEQMNRQDKVNRQDKMNRQERIVRLAENSKQLTARVAQAQEEVRQYLASQQSKLTTDLPNTVTTRGGNDILPKTVTVRGREENLANTVTVRNRKEKFRSARAMLEHYEHAEVVQKKRSKLDEDKENQNPLKLVGHGGKKICWDINSNQIRNSGRRNTGHEFTVFDDNTSIWPTSPAPCKLPHQVATKSARASIKSNVSLNDISSISRASEFVPIEQPSTGNQSGAMHSTAKYPLHSTIVGVSREDLLASSVDSSGCYDETILGGCSRPSSNTQRLSSNHAFEEPSDDFQFSSGDWTDCEDDDTVLAGPNSHSKTVRNWSIPSPTAVLFKSFSFSRPFSSTQRSFTDDAEKTPIEPLLKRQKANARLKRGSADKMTALAEKDDARMTGDKHLHVVPSTAHLPVCCTGGFLQKILHIVSHKKKTRKGKSSPSYFNSVSLDEEQNNNETLSAEQQHDFFGVSAIDLDDGSEEGLGENVGSASAIESADATKSSKPAFFDTLHSSPSEISGISHPDVSADDDSAHSQRTMTRDEKQRILRRMRSFQKTVKRQKVVYFCDL